MHLLIVALFWWIIGIAAASAACPATPANCPSPAFNNLTVGGTSTLSGPGVAASWTGTGAIKLPIGTTGQQPDTGNFGEVRANSTTGLYEFGVGGSWANFLRTTGGTVTGALSITAAGTALSVTNNATMGGWNVTGTALSTIGSNWTYDYSQATLPTTRWAYFNNTLSPSVDATHIWEGGISAFLTLTGPGRATAEINVGHSYFQANSDAVSTSTIEGYEVSGLNQGTLATWRDYIGIFTNDTTGTMTDGANIAFQFRNNNTTAGAVTNWSFMAVDAMLGAGSVPSNFYLIRNKEPKALLGTLGGVHIGSIGALSGAIQLEVLTADNLSSSISMKVRNSDLLDVLYTTNNGVTNSPKFNGVYTNGASATTTSWFAHSGALINQNAGAGSVTTFAAYNMDPMTGAGSLPTNYYLVRGNDANALLATLGKVHVGSIGAVGASNMLQIEGAGHVGSTFPLLARNDNAENVLLMGDHGSLSLGSVNNQGQLQLNGSTSGNVVLRGNSATASATWFLQDLTGGSDTVVGRATTDTLTNKTLTDFIDRDTVRSTAATNVASSTVLVNATGLAVALTASGQYAIHGYLPMTVNGTPGATIALGTSDTLTATAMSYSCELKNGTTTTAGGTPVTSLGAACVDAAVAGDHATIDGVIAVSAAGTLTVQVAQHTSDLTATSILSNGYITARRLQ